MLAIVIDRTRLAELEGNLLQDRCIVITPDPIEELKLRRWAREHYVPEAERAADWHPIVLDEMRTRDEEELIRRYRKEDIRKSWYVLDGSHLEAPEAARTSDTTSAHRD